MLLCLIKITRIHIFNDLYLFSSFALGVARRWRFLGRGFIGKRFQLISFEIKNYILISIPLDSSAGVGPGARSMCQDTM